MTPQELEDEIIANLITIEDQYLAAVDERDSVIVRANEEFRQTTYHLGFERMRVLMSHTVRAMTEIK